MKTAVLCASLFVAGLFWEDMSHGIQRHFIKHPTVLDDGTFLIPSDFSTDDRNFTLRGDWKCYAVDGSHGAAGGTYVSNEFTQQFVAMSGEFNCVRGEL